MSVERARAYLAKFGQADRIITFPTSSATVELAAQAAGTEPCRIAKSMSFQTKEGPILIVTAGDTKIDNSKFKHFFGEKAKMLPFEEVEPAIGHAVGGVCPFGVNEGVRVYLDVSLRRFPTVFPAAGEANNAIELTPAELEQYTDNQGWIDVCKGWQQPAEA
jgi:prolyl-tRNA editing enzyme YbaK/EbsC (Cys-tRNA(Pro) deacylase)